MYKTPQNLADITKAIYGGANIEIKVEYLAVFLLDLLDKLKGETTKESQRLQNEIAKILPIIQEGDNTTNGHINSLVRPILAQLEGFKGVYTNLQDEINILKDTPITYTLTDNDKKDIASQIEVPIVQEKVIVEKTETIVKEPVITNEVVEVAMYETPEAIRDKLESIEVEDQKLDQSAIKGLKDELKSLESKVNSKSSVRGGANTRPLTGDLVITNDGSKITGFSWQHGSMSFVYDGYKLVSATGSGIYGNSSYTYSGNWLTNITIS